MWDLSVGTREGTEVDGVAKMYPESWTQPLFDAFLVVEIEFLWTGHCLRLCGLVTGPVLGDTAFVLAWRFTYSLQLSQLCLHCSLF